MESEDYSFYQGLVFLLENDVKDLGYELTFSTEVMIHTAYSHVYRAVQAVAMLLILGVNKSQNLGTTIFWCVRFKNRM